jgi:hypothetical protein
MGSIISGVWVNVKGLLAKNFVLAGLAHTANAVLVTATLITEGGRGGTVTGHAETLTDDVLTDLAPVKEGEESVERGVFLSGVHACIIPDV